MASQDNELELIKQDYKALIRFNRPEAHNAMTWHMYEALKDACDECDKDPAIKVIVFSGAGGKAFVSGTDIKQFLEFRYESSGIEYEKEIDKVIGRIEELQKPTIARIDGVCVGGGAAIALACDFRYATPELRFGVPIARTLGNCLSINNVCRLIDMAGVAKAKEILMLGRVLRADEAGQCGIVNGIVEPELLNQEVDRIAERLASNAPLTMMASKESINRVLAARRADSGAANDLIKMCYSSHDFHGAVRAFIDKTDYSWQGI